ncbi:DUF7133 domain-containing protein [Rubritalea marina]|uniref:DUF7133 domain-containing protein n=1 Tax=Rubritalea marina TaxID=361055 RepID=UPI0003A92AE2|nr:HEAT repeat domain-containing protein [Rubritalea marina]
MKKQYYSILVFILSVAVSSAALQSNRFATSEQSPCPAVIAAAPTGEVFVGVDQQGSLGKEVGAGKVVRLVDSNHDGQADEVTDFTIIDNPRGITVLGNQVIILHTTTENGEYLNQQLTLFEDLDWDGVADGPGKPLVTNLGNSKFIRSRGLDHCTNNIRYAIDGWIYISVGDFGFVDAEGTDGRTLTMYGGVARVRPDGSGLEAFVTGTRNVYDVAIDPFLNVFTRENTNDGIGWWVRASHYIQSADYGYPNLYTHFPEDMLPAMGEYGNGSGVGALYLDEPQWEEPFNKVPLLADWGVSKVFVHKPIPFGATFTNAVSEFKTVTQVSDLDVDGSGRLYIAAWAGAGYMGTWGKKARGYVERVVPEGWQYEPFPELKEVTTEALISLMQSESMVARTHSAYELIQRGEGTEELSTLAASASARLESRVAAIFTMLQIQGEQALPTLESLVRDPDVREFAIKAMGDDLKVASHAKAGILKSALHDSNPRVQVAAAIALGRTGSLQGVAALLRAAAQEPLGTVDSLRENLGVVSGDIEASDYQLHSVPRKDVLSHVAQKSLVNLGAHDAVAATIRAGKGKGLAGALATAKQMYSTSVVDALIERSSSADAPLKAKILEVLMRMSHREKVNDGKTWWGTRPDPHGPYFAAVSWEGTAKVQEYLKSYIDQAEDKAPLIAQLRKHKAFVKPYHQRHQNQKKKVKRVGGTAIEDIVLHLEKYQGKPENGAKVIRKVGCAGCHNVSHDGVIKGPDLTKLGNMTDADLAEAIIQPAATIAKSWVTLTTKDGMSHLGTVVKDTETEIVLHNIAGVATQLKPEELVSRAPGLNMMSLHLCDALTLEEFGDLVAYIKSLDTNQ